MRSSILTFGISITVSALGANAIAQANAHRYVVTDLGDLGGEEAVATSINGSGQIVGFSYLTGHTLNAPCDERRAFLYTDGGMSELASLPGARFATASAISNTGDVSGTNDVYVADASCTDGCFPGYCGRQTPTLIRGGGPIDLSAPLPWYAGVANDVNNIGQVVGWSRKADLPNPRTWHAYLWENGVRTDLGTLASDWSIATGINDEGLVVGYSQLQEGSGLWYAFRWSDGVMEVLPALGTNTYNGANDVNAAGDAAGWSGPDSTRVRPVFFPASGDAVDLGSLGGADGSGFALNDRGVVVGYSYTAGNQSRHAFVHQDNRLSDLNELIPLDAEWELIAATDVNDVGQIVGYGCRGGRAVPPASCEDENGLPTFRRAFLLTPIVSIGDLEDLIVSLDLPKGLETSLLSKLAAAQRAIDAGRIATGCNLLAALANEVEAKSGSGLTPAEAELILQTLRLIQADLGCI